MIPASSINCNDNWITAITQTLGSITTSLLGSDGCRQEHLLLRSPGYRRYNKPCIRTPWLQAPDPRLLHDTRPLHTCRCMTVETTYPDTVEAQDVYGEGEVHNCLTPDVLLTVHKSPIEKRVIHKSFQHGHDTVLVFP